MKDHLFELLLNLFEQSLSQLHKGQETDPQDASEEDNILWAEDETLIVKPAQDKSTRILIYEEQVKLTKASYQFLMKMKLWNIIDNNDYEAIISQLLNSDSHNVLLEETKWTIRNVLEPRMNAKQLAFLDLVLYQKEDELPMH